MNIVWSRLYRSVYRREPIVGFVATVGAVDAAIGGLNQHWSLLVVGLGTVGGAIALRLWQLQRRSALEQIIQPPVHILPPQSARPSLPPLPPKKRPAR